MALVALGFRWGNAPPWFTVTLLVLAWLIFSISVYKHKFFERWSPFRQLLGNAGVSVVIALILSAAWVGLRPSIQRQAVTQSATPSPTVATVVASPAPEPPPKTLHDYFAEGNHFAIETMPQQLRVKNESVNVEARINMDYVARARFLTFYVPDTPHTFEACSLILTRSRATIEEFDREFHDEYGPIEGRKTGMKDLKFTGQIIIYHQRLLLQSEIDSLTAKATKAGLSVEFRGTYYVMARMK